MDLQLDDRLRLGISSCLLGEAVRYDGNDERDHWIADRFDAFTDWMRVCPEAEAGLGVPRPKIRLEREGAALRVRENEAGIDHTDTLQSWADGKLVEFDVAALDGWIFKARSPSCGVEGVGVFEGDREIDRQPGFFAARLHAIDPLLPTCTEDDVQVPEARRHFLERAQTRSRWRRLVATLPSDDDARGAALKDFFARHALLLRCRERPAVEPKGMDPARLEREFFASMHAAPTVDGHVAALTTIFDRLGALDVHARTALGIQIDQAARGEMDVEVPRQLARGLVLRFGDEALRRQHYFDPAQVTPIP